MTKKKLFIWVCDYSRNTGEGKLARLFIKILNKKKIYKLQFNQKNTLKEKYISTFYGIIYCWYHYFKKNKVCYLNYLPFWNFIIFCFLPPKTILGPITGGANFLKIDRRNAILRGIIFPIFYKISEFFLNLRNIKIIFSTDLLKKFLSKKTIQKSSFNFVINNFLFKKKINVNKTIDFIIYYRKHKNKLDFFSYCLIKKLVKNNFKIYVVGEKLNIPSVINLGYLNNKKIDHYQSKAKYTIASNENLYSFFILECLSNNVKIVVTKKTTSKINIFKDKFIQINNNSIKKINRLKNKK